MFFSLVKQRGGNESGDELRGERYWRRGGTEGIEV